MTLNGSALLILAKVCFVWAWRFIFPFPQIHAMMTKKLKYWSKISEFEPQKIRIIWILFHNQNFKSHLREMGFSENPNLLLWNFVWREGKKGHFNVGANEKRRLIKLRSPFVCQLFFRSQSQFCHLNLYRYYIFNKKHLDKKDQLTHQGLDIEMLSWVMLCPPHIWH